MRKFIKKYNVIQQTFEGFYENFNSYQEEEFDEFREYFGEYDEKELELDLKSIDLKVINLSEMIDDAIVSTLSIIYKGRYFGQYRLVFDLNGDITDNVFVLY